MGNLPSGTLTFLFTDLESSTELWEKFPQEMKSVLAMHDSILKEAVKSNNGTIVKTTGDGIHAVFSTAVEAVDAALYGQRKIKTAVFSANAELSIRVRMGIHTGESELRDGDYYGTTLNRAARIMSIAHGGQVLLSETTLKVCREQISKNVSTLDLGEHRLKGIAAPEHIFQLCHPDLVNEFPPLKSLASFKHNLHIQSSTFIGRKKEMADVKRLLGNVRLLTLLGPGGTGKTRLMLQVAEEAIENYPDGVWLVELAPLTDPDLIPERVMSTLNIQDQPGRPILDTLTDYLRHKNLLLLLDNVEHLVRASAELAEHLLEQCPKITILVTGREALFIDGETTLQIPSLSIPKEKQTLDEISASEGVQLFMERARAVRPDFSITDQNADSIVEIVRRLDGIPLALELAAARLRMLTVEQIAARLNDRFRLLTGGRRTALPRQQTLQALIDWSWQLLDEKEQVLLRRLSVFTGGWSLEAAQVVTGQAPLDEYEVFDTLEQLINKSLVIVRYPSEGETRYSMLESIRQFAQDKLFEASEGETMRNRHVDYYVALVDQFEQSSLESAYFTWMQRFSLEGDNLRAVVGWIAEDRPRLALHFMGILLQYDPMWLPYREARSWLEPVLERARDLVDESEKGPPMRDFIRALQALGWLLVTHGDMIGGHSLLDESIHLSREHGEYQILALTMGMKAQALGSSVTQDIVEQLDEIADICRQKGYKVELLMVVFSTAHAHILLGHLDQAKIYLAQVRQMMTNLHVPIINTWVDYLQALLEMVEHNLAGAEKYLIKAIEANEKWGLHRMAATARSELAHLYRQQKRLEEAAALYHQTILSWQEQGHLSAVAHQLECFAYLAIMREQYKQAARLLGAAQNARQRLNAFSTDQQELADLNQAMAQLADALGDDERDRVMAEGEKMSLDEAVAFATAA